MHTLHVRGRVMRGRGSVLQSTFILLGSLALLAPGIARAQDGGSRSVLAEGAGNRAIAMGGSFAALSGDVSGLLWNPGGIGAISRLQIEGGQSRYSLLGVSEAYAMAALPDWRWGVAAASFRHVGVDDIEVRDDRNIATGSTISNSETEVAVGYARTLGEIGSMGGSFRARRQSLGPYSANGFGVDLGIVARPLSMLGRDSRGLSVGFVLGNLVRPSLRLDRESVADPTTARTGIAWQTPWGAQRSLILTADLEKPAGLAATVHAGFEVQVFPQFALRGGLADGVVSAGSGLRWNDITLDYAFENTSLQPVHRFGVSYAFGRSVTQNRDAARAADEEKLQARLNEGFQKRQNEQTASLLARALERRSAGAMDEAIDLLASVIALDPGHIEAVSLQASYHRERGLQLEQSKDHAGALVAYGRAAALAPEDSLAKAGLARSRDAIDRGSLRSSEARRLFAQALEAFGADKLAAARRGFRSVLEIQDGDPDAVAMLQRTNDAIARRVRGLLREADRSLEAGRTDDVAEVIDQVAQLDPQTPGLEALRASLGRARAADARVSTSADSVRARARKTPTGTPSATLSPKELDLLYRRGLMAMQERRPDEALRFWELVWSANPNYGQVAEYLKRELMTQGMEAFAAGRLDEAAGFWRRALRVDPNDQRTRGYLERARQQLSRTREMLGGN